MAVDKAAAARFIKAGLVGSPSCLELFRIPPFAFTNTLLSLVTKNTILQEQSK